MLGTYRLNKLRVLRVVDMRAERDLVNRQLARESMTLDGSNLIRFVLDFLGMSMSYRYRARVVAQKNSQNRTGRVWKRLK